MSAVRTCVLVWCPRADKISLSLCVMAERKKENLNLPVKMGKLWAEAKVYIREINMNVKGIIRTTRDETFRNLKYFFLSPHVNY